MQSALDSTQQPPTWALVTGIEGCSGRQWEKGRKRETNLWTRIVLLHGKFRGGKGDTFSKRKQKDAERANSRQTDWGFTAERNVCWEDLNLTMGVLRQGEKCSSDIMLCLVHAGFIKWSICLLMCLLLCLLCVNIFESCPVHIKNTV